MSNKYLDIAIEKIVSQEVNKILEQIRTEIEVEITPNLCDEQAQAFSYVLQIIDKYTKGVN